jgi:MFS family permease
MPKGFSVNKIIRTVSVSDIMVFASLSMLGPILPVFVTSELPNGSLPAAGIAIGLQWVTRGLCELPVAYFLDKHKGEYDDFISLIAGSLMVSLVPILFLFAKSIYHVYFIQIIFGLGYALNHPAWAAIMSRHVDSGHVAWEWGLYGVCYSLGIGLAGMASGYLAGTYGYSAVFWLVGIISIIGSAYLITIRSQMLKQAKA